MVNATTQIVIPARSGKAAFVQTGQALTVINTHGQQVVDTWAFSSQDLHEFMSMEHSRQHTLTIFPTVGTCPLNLFMNIPIQPDGKLSIQPPISTPGSYVTFRAEMDLLVVFSACPQDLVPVNGIDCVPTEAHFEIFDL